MSNIYGGHAQHPCHKALGMKRHFQDTKVSQDNNCFIYVDVFAWKLSGHVDDTNTDSKLL
jgi:hypothetical protein